MENKDGQISVVYLGLLTMVSIVLFGMVFIWFTSMKGTATTDFNEHHADALLTGFEQKLLELRNTAETPNGSPKSERN